MQRFLTFLVALTLVGVAPPASSDEEMETIAFEKLSHTQRSEISTAGAAVLRDIVEARSSLEKKDGAAARRALGSAAEQLRGIRGHSPSAGLSDGIAGLHQALVEGAGGDAANLAPIYAQLDTYQAVAGEAAAEEIRGDLDRTQGKLDAGEHAEAAILLEEARRSVRYVEIDLPVSETLARVDRAITQIGKNDYLGADGNLRESLGSLQVFGEMASIEMEAAVEAVGMGPE